MGQGIAQIVVYTAVLIGLAYPLGLYMARVYTAPRFGGRVLAPVERVFYRIVGTDPKREQDWKSYAKTVLVFSVFFFLVVYAIQRLQAHIFLNPNHNPAVPAHLSLNTAASFITNTNWQFYGGESTMSYFTQMTALAVQQFVSAGVGMAVLAAVIRGIARRSTGTLGNFWVDLYRSLVYIFLPLSLILGFILLTQGDPQTFGATVNAHTLEGTDAADRARAGRADARDQAARDERRRLLQLELRRPVREPERNHELPRGARDPAHPRRARSSCSGRWFWHGVMRSPSSPRWSCCSSSASLSRIPAEQHGSQVLRASGVNITQGNGQSGGNMADKEVRFGIANTALWATATTDASNGSVDGGHDAFTAFGGAVPLVNIFFGEVVFGGVGTGLYGMFFYIIIAVFVAGLMVGRTPEWLGKKIEAREIKYAAVGALFVPTMVLTLAAISIATKSGMASIFNPGAHGFTETLYAYTSQSNNNGSAFAGFGLTNFSADFGAVAMLLGRFAPMLAALALAGALGKKKIVPASAGTFRTDGPTFVILLVGVILLTAGLMIFPALTLGPIVEGLTH